jgi:hypothetical protein
MNKFYTDAEFEKILYGVITIAADEGFLNHIPERFLTYDNLHILDECGHNAIVLNYEATDSNTPRV